MAQPGTVLQLRNFVLEHLDGFQASGGSSGPPRWPEFDFTGRDYLAFAETELSGSGAANKINCVGHLKRAVDCQIDSFLHQLGLFRVVQQNNLSFGQKLKFLARIAVLTGRTIERFNNVRNEMEHRYAHPELESLEVYYDLCTAVVALLERTALMAHNNEDEYFVPLPEDGENEENGPTLTIGYEPDPPAVFSSWDNGRRRDERTLRHLPAETDEFPEVLRIFFLLKQRLLYSDSRWIREQLQGK